MLEQESKRCLYGSSPTTPDPPSFLKSPHAYRNSASPSCELPRSNSTGSAGSSHSSGRSTPVNATPTPWLVPPGSYAPNIARQVSSPGILPPGTVCINGSYYQPLPNAGPMPGVPYPVPISNVHTSPKSQQTSPVLANQTLQNSAYPAFNNSYCKTGAGQATNQCVPLSTISPQAIQPGVVIPTGYFAPTSQTYPSSYPMTAQLDSGYHGLLGKQLDHFHLQQKISRASEG